LRLLRCSELKFEVVTTIDISGISLPGWTRKTPRGTAIKTSVSTKARRDLYATVARQSRDDAAV